MRKYIIYLCGLFFLVGCGSNTPVVSSKNSDATTSQEAVTYDEEYYSEQLAFCNITITGIETEWKDEYEMHMYDGVIKELADDYMIAEGHLTDEWNNTVDKVSVKYEIYDGSIDSGELVKTEASDDNIVLILTPSTPFDLEKVYNDEVKLIFDGSDGNTTSKFLTKDNYPSIEFVDTWFNNYTYNGHIIYTDADGNKWITREDRIKETYRYEGSVIGNDCTYKWKFSFDSLCVVPYE